MLIYFYFNFSATIINEYTCQGCSYAVCTFVGECHILGWLSYLWVSYYRFLGLYFVHNHEPESSLSAPYGVLHHSRTYVTAGYLWLSRETLPYIGCRHIYSLGASLFPPRKGHAWSMSSDVVFELALWDLQTYSELSLIILNITYDSRVWRLTFN